MSEPVTFVGPRARRSAWLRARVLLDESWKYFLVSLVALGVDYGLLVFETAVVHVNYLVSAAVGFTAGLVVNYVLSVAFVFHQHRLTSRGLEFAGFFVVGVLGLALNELLMKMFVESFGLSYVLAKIPATGVGFLFNFGARKALLFTARRPAGADPTHGGCA